MNGFRLLKRSQSDNQFGKNYCSNQKIDYGTYSLFANIRWGTEEQKELVKETRLREVMNHKKLNYDYNIIIYVLGPILGPKSPGTVGA